MSENETLLFFSYGKQDLSRMPKRPAESNKGTFGRVVLVCGSVGMAGAAYLSAKAAYRVGAGLVEIVTPTPNLPVLQTLIPEAIVTPYDPALPDADVIAHAISRADALVVGCGLGKSEAARAVLCTALSVSDVPIVLDADALNLIAEAPALLPHLAGKIITPHPMEMSRLCARPVEDILGNIAECAQTFAKAHGCVCVLKDHRTVVSDGSPRIYRNESGNSGMATGGSGDVLAGILGGILAQQKRAHTRDRLETAALGVYLHGLLGDCAAERLGEYAVMASDLIDAIPDVLRPLRK